MNSKDYQNILKDNPFIPVKDAVYKLLYDQIISLKIAPGTVVNASAIADALNISRSPVHAAIMQLENDNLVVKKTGKRMQVAPVRYQDCCQLAETRIGIECAAAYALAPVITDAQLAELKKILEEYNELNTCFNIEKYVALDDAFHTSIVEFTGNPYLINTYHLIRGSILRYRWYMSPRIHHGKLEINEYRSHLSIYDALVSHHASLARDEMKVSLDRLFAVTYFLKCEEDE